MKYALKPNAIRIIFDGIMPVVKEHIFEQGIYFVTFTNYKWLRLFEISNGYEFVYKWFDSLARAGHTILGYVIMPNHVHALLGYVKCTKSLNTILGNGKRFMAYDLAERLEQLGNQTLLDVLSRGVPASEKRRGKRHEVFQDTFDAKLCLTYKFVQQKLDYIHSNPVSKKWSLVREPTHYEHSSAKFYATGKQGRYPVLHVNDWIFEYWK